MSALILYDDFRPGERLGEASLIYTSELASNWEREDPPAPE